MKKLGLVGLALLAQLQFGCEPNSDAINDSDKKKQEVVEIPFAKLTHVENQSIRVADKNNEESYNYTYKTLVFDTGKENKLNIISNIQREYIVGKSYNVKYSVEYIGSTEEEFFKKYIDLEDDYIVRLPEMMPLNINGKLQQLEEIQEKPGQLPIDIRMLQSYPYATLIHKEDLSMMISNRRHDESFNFDYKILVFDVKDHANLKLITHRKDNYIKGKTYYLEAEFPDFQTEMTEEYYFKNFIDKEDDYIIRLPRNINTRIDGILDFIEFPENMIW